MMILSLHTISSISVCPIRSPLRSRAPACTTCCSRITSEFLKLQSDNRQLKPSSDKYTPPLAEANRDVKDDPTNGNGKSFDDGVSGVQVPRSRYVSVSKSELLNAIVTTLFDSEAEAELFIQMATGLDSILHAEHKCILEEMRVHYDLTHTSGSSETSGVPGSSGTSGVSSELEREFMEKRKELDAFISKSVELFLTKEGYLGDSAEGGKSSRKVDLESQSDQLSDNSGKSSFKLSRAAADTQFQRAFVQLLYNAEFEELSVRDLLLASALNNDYLLTLPIYVDWKKASESNAIIYRRGYTTEKQKGLLTGEKLDYLQSKFLQKIFSLIARPLGNVGLWLMKEIGGSTQDDYMRGWVENLQLWLKKLVLPPQSYSSDAVASSNQLDVDHLRDTDIPIRLAAQKALIRYEGILSAIGPRGRLLRKFLMWIGVLSTDPQQAFNNESTTIDFEAESCPRPIFLPRVSLSDIWEPASWENCGSDMWKQLKTSISILLSKSTLQEPAFAEIVLLYTELLGERDTEDKAGGPALQLKIYEKIPVPDLTVIFPYKKLSFRILDAVRLDLATILGLLAFFVNYKFLDVRSSPSAVLLDIIAASALLIYVFRVVLGYKQTRDRYQLLVNKTLYEKTVASGFGSVHFLLDSSQQQLYKEAILAYAILLKADARQAPYASIGGRCEEFLDNAFKKRIEMPVNKAKSTLVRLGLIEEKIVDGEIVLEAVPCSQACEILRHRWGVLLT